MFVEQPAMNRFKRWDWNDRGGKKSLQSSVIVPRNEIDSHPTEREITLADDTAVTAPKTQHDSNMNNQQQKHTRTHTHTSISLT